MLIRGETARLMRILVSEQHVVTVCVRTIACCECDCRFILSFLFPCWPSASCHSPLSDVFFTSEGRSLYKRRQTTCVLEQQTGIEVVTCRRRLRLDARDPILPLLLPHSLSLLFLLPSYRRPQLNTSSRLQSKRNEV